MSYRVSRDGSAWSAVQTLSPGPDFTLAHLRVAARTVDESFAGFGLWNSQDGGQQNPPVTTKGKGTATLTFDTTKKKLSWNVKYSGLSGPATAAHIHGPAAKGENADPVIPFKKVKSPIKGTATLTDAQAADLEAGKYYVNVHTKANAGGEIRGQIEKAM